MSILLRATAVVLAGFYGYVLLLLFHPNVSEEYRNYYIAETTQLTITEQQQLAPVQVDELYSYSNPAIGFDGWRPAENGFRWSKADRVQIVFMLAAGDLAMPPSEIVLHLTTLGPQRVNWQLNGTPLAETALDGEEEVRLPISAAPLRDGKNTLQIYLPDAHESGNNDHRVLAIALKSFQIR